MTIDSSDRAASLLEGAYDLHIHCAPDVVDRIITDDEMANRALACSMRGFAIKSHYTPTSDRAAGIRTRYPGLNAIGTLTLNTSVGGINPMAVETAARLGAKMIWFPTMDSGFQQYLIEHLPHHVDMQVGLRERGMEVKPVRVLDEKGKLVEEARQILDLAKCHSLVVGTGHISHAESFALAEAARESGFDRLVITHVDWMGTRYGVKDQLRLVKMGAFVEHCFSDSEEGLVTYESTFDQVRQIGAAHVILTSDLGKTTGALPDDGLAKFVDKFLQAGFSERDVRMMIAENPARLVEC